MKISEQRPNDSRRQRTEAIVARHMDQLFHRLPTLLGFCLRTDLQVVELSLCSWPGCGAGMNLYEEVMKSLAELTEERPEAVQLMRGRTFARAVH